MVQIIENRADVSGELLSSAPDPDRPGHVQLQIRIDASRPVSGYPDLLANLVGSTVTVVAKADAPVAVQTPGPVSFRARRTSPSGVFAE